MVFGREWLVVGDVSGVLSAVVGGDVSGLIVPVEVGSGGLMVIWCWVWFGAIVVG